MQLRTDNKNSVIVDYVVLKEMLKAADSNNKEVTVKVADIPARPVLGEQKKEELKPQAGIGKINIKDGPDHPGVAGSASGSGVGVKEGQQSGRNRDYMNYYQLIREKVRKRLKDNYGYYNREGEVCLSFTIRPNGSLISYSIDRAKSAKDEVLLHITVASLKAVSPFPPVPRSLLTTPNISFNIVISFKK